MAVNNVENILFLDLDIKAAKFQKKKKHGVEKRELSVHKFDPE